MKQFKKGINYLTFIKNVSCTKRGLYRCEICGNTKDINIKMVEIGHDKTCGCMNNNGNKFEINITRDGRALSPTGYDISCKIAKGYRGVKAKNGASYLHRMVAEKYIPNPNGYTDVNHINGIKSDNRVENLEWCSRSYNISHAIRTGLNPRTSGFVGHSRALKNAKDVEYIINSKETLKELSKKFNISITAISNIRRGITYKILDTGGEK